MPNRIIKESICTSDNIDQLTPFEETFFVRLIVNCDDFGRMDARVKILASRLFPLKEVKPCQIMDAVKSLVKADLITVYEVNGKMYLQFNTWESHQQIRAKKSKYPSPDEGICNQLISDDIKCPRNPIQSNTNPIRNTNTKFSPPTVDEVKAYCDELKYNIDPQYFIDYYTARGWELKPGQKVKDWKACIRTWRKRDSINPAKVVAAQNFQQRDYSDVPGQMVDELAQEMKEFQKGAG